MRMMPQLHHMGKDKGLVFGQGNGFPELDRKARNRKLYKRRGYIPPEDNRQE